MRRAEQQPVIPEKWVMILRIAVIGAAYLLYRVLERSNPFVESLFVGLGFLIVAYSVINRYGLWRKERSGMLQVGQTILGLGLMAIGLGLILA